MSNHTPGPWRAVIRSNQTGVRMAAVDMPDFGTCWGPKSKTRDFDAEIARLIAAAPDMLGALEEICDWHRHPETAEMLREQPQAAYLTIRNIAERAIAKARGEAS